MKRVGVLRGGAPHGIEDKIARYNELTTYGSSTAYSDGEGILG
jgi:stearoyl-CoA desaturase (delta-9 desaturase)